MNNYTVIMRYVHPAWNETDGIRYNVQAPSRSMAISKVKARAFNDGNYDRQQRATFTAKQTLAGLT